MNIFKTKTKKLALAYVENRKRQALKNILSKARILISEKTDAETHPVYLLIKELANLVYSETIYENISTQENNKVTKVTINQIIPEERKEFGKYLYIKEHSDFRDDDGKIGFFDLKYNGKLDIEENIKLGKDPVIACPWNPDRLTRAMYNITNDWIQDSNHKVALWLPYGITFVESGNHSITVGYLRDIGEIKTTEVYNVGDIHTYVYTDGVYYFRKEDDSICGEVTNFYLTAIFAIGGLIHDKMYNGRQNGIKINFHGKDVNWDYRNNIF